MVVEDICTAGLDAEIASYINTHTYADARNREGLWTKIRYAMPRTPLLEVQGQEPGETDQAEVSMLVLQDRNIGYQEGMRPHRNYFDPPDNTDTSVLFM